MFSFDWFLFLWYRYTSKYVDQFYFMKSLILNNELLCVLRKIKLNMFNLVSFLNGNKQEKKTVKCL